MVRMIFTKMVAGAVASLALFAWTSQADAFGHHRWHGSSGSWGSYGGSSGYWGSSGGSSGYWGGSSGHWGGHWGHHRHLGGSWGSSGGSWGSSGGSSGGWGSSGGSSGGVYYYAPADGVPADGSTPVPSTTTPPAATPEAGKQTSIRGTDGLLAVNVPEDAKIYVNGQATTSSGGSRQYVSRDLKSGFNYTYEVRAEVVRDGRTIEQVKKVDLRAGETANLAFDFPASDSVETSLTVHVPSDAKVFLAGNATKASGETRVFRTTGLNSGKIWEGYTVKVELERGGRTITKEETITLQAGQSQELRFDFDGDKLASVR